MREQIDKDCFNLEEFLLMRGLDQFVRRKEVTSTLGVSFKFFILLNIFWIVNTVLGWLPIRWDGEFPQLVSILVVHHEIKRLYTPFEIETREESFTDRTKYAAVVGLLFLVKLNAWIESVVHDCHDLPFEMAYRKINHSVGAHGFNCCEDE